LLPPHGWWIIAGMKVVRGKLVRVAVCIAALSIAVYTFWGPIAQQYFFLKLERQEMGEAEAAEAGLRMGPIAVPALLKVIATDFDPTSPRVWCGNCMHVSRWHLASVALESMGTTAAPALRDALKDDNPRIRRAAASALTKIERE
jgi:hypothetical protein